jgi:dTDP-4-dehydrorhamnose reductase
VKVLMSGGGGQLATALVATCPDGVTLHACTIDQLDVTDDGSVEEMIRRIRPDAVINAAAYTAVDAAESDESTAGAVNRDGAANLARSAARIDARMIQVSTDFVFDGSAGTPLRPDDPTNPISVYGRTKLEGELAVREILGPSALVVRTAWLYSTTGSNFVKTMLRLMQERGEVRVVNDQLGTPTRADSLAVALWCMLERDLAGIQHWTDDGIASWHDFAVAIAEIGTEQGLLERKPEVIPVPSTEFPTPATRPAFSVLDKKTTWANLDGTRCMPCVHWRENLATMLGELHGA